MASDHGQSGSGNPRWRVCLFSQLRVYEGDRPVTGLRGKARALLAYLAYHKSDPHPRDVLCEAIWPSEEVDSRHCLSMALGQLRKGLDASAVIADRESVRLAETEVSTDVGDFEAELRAADRAPNAAARACLLRRAVDLYTGPLLRDVHDHWVLSAAGWWRERHTKTMIRLVDDLCELGASDTALDDDLRGPGADPSPDAIHRQVILLYAARGDPGTALRYYRELKERFEREKLPLTSETRELSERIATGWRPQSAAGERGAGDSGLRVADLGRSPHAPPQVGDLQRRPENAPDSAQGSGGATSRPGSEGSDSSCTPPGIRPEPRSSATQETAGTNGDGSDTPGGAVPLGSRYYVARPVDNDFHMAVERGASIVVVRGPRQVGKSSLMARGLEQARARGRRVVNVTFQSFTEAELESTASILHALAHWIACELRLENPTADSWGTDLPPILKFEQFLRHQVFPDSALPLVLGLDEVDCLFWRSFGSELFGAFRSWHDARAKDPDGPWRRLTMIIATSTEPQLFIKDLNQSPFNVGTQLELVDFTHEEVADLNERYGSPLSDADALRRFYDLLGGHPFLTQRALHELATRRIHLDDVIARAGDEGWILGGHLRRIRRALEGDPLLRKAAWEATQGVPCSDTDSFYRLCSGGVLTGASPSTARVRCRLYAAYLRPLLNRDFLEPS